jgi:hypothetical protein
MKKVFKIKTPAYQNTDIVYTENSNKCDLIQERVLNNWQDYCYEHWIWQKKFKDGKLNYEDKVKMLLDRCATFLLLPYMKRGMIMSDYKIKDRHINEIPVSSCGTIIEDEFYSSDFEEDEYREQKKYYKKFKTNKKNLKYNKINKIYSSVDKKIIEYKKLNNKEIYDKNNIQYPEFNSKEELEKWLIKPFLNLHKENIYDIHNKNIIGHDGYINNRQTYKWDWCYVNTDNIFTFNNHKYKISDEVKQYKVYEDNQCEMDIILVFEQNGNQFFFDMNINNIKNKFIMTIK